MQNIKSKALVAAIFFRFNTNKNLVDLDPRLKGILLIGIIVLIESFEFVLNGE